MLRVVPAYNYSSGAACSYAGKISYAWLSMAHTRARKMNISCTLVVGGTQLVLVSLERMRVPMSMQDMEDYLHLWRLIGHYMGVDSVLGAQVFDFESTEAMLESVMLHLVEPDDTSAFISFNVLESVARYSPTKYTVEVCAKSLKLPPCTTPSAEWFAIWLFVAVD